MSLLERFLDPSHVDLKICGVTVAAEAEKLVQLGVAAMGVNFWPKSKRYLDPAHAEWLESLTGRILRVGVFVNAESDHVLELHSKGWIDAIQLHGDESPEDAVVYQKAGVPFIKAIGVSGQETLANAAEYQASALLLDAHAPDVYGGTGETFDWHTAVEFKETNPETPVILAGGLVPGNAAEAVKIVHPCALDVASGAELSPGIKDFHKVEQLLQATRS